MWHTLTNNPQAITSLYDEVPLLHGVHLMRLELEYVKPRLELSIDLLRFADHPPERWIRDGATTVQLYLNCDNVRDLNVAGWNGDLVIDIEITRLQEDLLQLTGQGDEVRLHIVCQWIRIARLSGYAQ